MENITMDDFVFYRLENTGVELCLSKKENLDFPFIALSSSDGEVVYLQLINNGMKDSGAQPKNTGLPLTSAPNYKDELIFKKVDEPNSSFYTAIKKHYNIK